jgi:hypothetical protein
LHQGCRFQQALVGPVLGRDSLVRHDFGSDHRVGGCAGEGPARRVL